MGVPTHYEGPLTTSFGRNVWASIDYIRIRMRGETLLLARWPAIFLDFKAAEETLREAKQA